MKNPAYNLFLVLIVLIVLVSGCNSTKRTEGGAHNRGVNNSHFRGY
jgi:hypothetical protein